MTRQITYVGAKGRPIDFNGPVLDALAAKPEETSAIVRKDNGKFALAHYCYERFGNGQHWSIWTDAEYAGQFEAMIDLGLAKLNCRGWAIGSSVRYATAHQRGA